MSKLLKALSVGGLCVSALVAGVGGAVAGASPTKAPSANSGSFHCTTGRSGIYTRNSGHSTATPWNDAHLSFTGGGTGIFVPSVTSDTVMVIFPTGTFTTSSTKTKGNGHTPAPNTCDISAMGQFTTGGTLYTFSLTGTVMGMIVTNS